MQLSPYQISRQERLQPVYHLFGAEPLIIEEALNDLRTLCRSRDYLEREKLTVEPGFDWNSLLAAGQSLSLFATRRIIELRMPSVKPGTQGAKALVEYAKAPAPDSVLIVISGEIPRAAQRSAWFKALDKAGASVDAPRVQTHQMAGWIEKRAEGVSTFASTELTRAVIPDEDGHSAPTSMGALSNQTLLLIRWIPSSSMRKC